MGDRAFLGSPSLLGVRAARVDGAFDAPKCLSQPSLIWVDRWCRPGAVWSALPDPVALEPGEADCSP